MPRPVFSRARHIAPAVLLLSVLTLSGCSSLLPSNDPPPATDSTTGAEIEQESADVFTLAVGQCLNDAAMSGEVEAVPSVDCASEHDSEVFFLFDLDDDAFPGAAEISAKAESGCGDAFAAYIGVPYDQSRYVYSSYTPTMESWSAGDREIACVVFDADDAKLIGSLKGVAQ